jgi:hypothetical protein
LRFGFKKHNNLHNLYNDGAFQLNLKNAEEKKLNLRQKIKFKNEILINQYLKFVQILKVINELPLQKLKKLLPLKEHNENAQLHSMCHEDLYQSWH